MAELRAGAVLGNYRVDWLIGRGGMGTVYLAQHVRMATRKAALKVLSSELAEDPEFRERFIRESDLAGSLEHPNIIPVYDAGEADGVLYSAMRYVRGTDLGALIDLEGKLSPARTFRVMAAVGRALDFAHAHGLLHRDVKPGNVMIEPSRTAGGRERAFLTDFGLVKRLLTPTKLTRTGHLVGTLDYTAPEVFRGEELDGRADIYSLGCVLFECLTGSVPFPETTDAGVMYGHLQNEPPPVTSVRPELPTGLDVVVARAMAKDPEQRFATCAELLEATKQALMPSGIQASGEEPVSSTAPTERVDQAPLARTKIAEPPPLRVLPPPPRTEPTETHQVRPRRRRGRTALALVTAIAVLGAAALAFVSSRHGGRHAAAPNTVIATIPVGQRPVAATFGAGSLWVVNSVDGTVSRIDPATNSVVATIQVGSNPQSVAATASRVWVANAGDGTVSKIDTATNRVIGSIEVGRAPEGVVLTKSEAWVANAASNTVSDIERGTFSALRTFRVGAGPVAITSGGGAVWVANVADDSVSRIDPLSFRRPTTIPVPAGAVAVAFGGGALWVANGGERHGVVTRIDPVTRRIVAAIDVGPAPFGMTFSAGSLWVTQLVDGTVARIDPLTNRVVAIVPVGIGPAGAASGAQSVWITKGDATVARIQP